MAVGYVSYVTITVSINGHFTNKQIYDIVLNENLEVQNNAKTGISWTDEVEKINFKYFKNKKYYLIK